MNPPPPPIHQEEEARYLSSPSRDRTHITQINRSEAAASYELELDYESDSPDEKENFLKEAEAFNAEERPIRSPD